VEDERNVSKVCSSQTYESVLSQEFNHLEDFVRGTRMSRRDIALSGVDQEELNMYRGLFVES